MGWTKNPCIEHRLSDKRFVDLNLPRCFHSSMFERRIMHETGEGWGTRSNLQQTLGRTSRIYWRFVVTLDVSNEGLICFEKNLHHLLLPTWQWLSCIGAKMEKYGKKNKSPGFNTFSSRFKLLKTWFLAMKENNKLHPARVFDTQSLGPHTEIWCWAQATQTEDWTEDVKLPISRCVIWFVFCLDP